MHTLKRYQLPFALCLSMLAGCVDATGFLQLGGYFISFMSGNSTRLAVSLAQADKPRALLLAAIIALFVLGSALGTWVRARASRGRQMETVLALVTALLLVAAISYEGGYAVPAVLVMVLAMGAENATLRGDGDTIIGVTYMTGNLAKLGQRLAEALMGGRSWAWFPYLLLWCGLIAGGAAGATLYRLLGLHSLWIAAAWAAGLLFMQYRNAPKDSY